MGIPSLRQRFGSQVRRLRRDRGLTQEQLGERANLHPTYISAVERGEQSPSLETIGKLVTGLGVDVNELFQFLSPRANPREEDAVRARVLRLLRRKDPKKAELGLTILQQVFRWTERLR